MCTGGAYRPFLHDRHFSAASSFQIGVSRGRRIASSGMLARVSAFGYASTYHHNGERAMKTRLILLTAAMLMGTASPLYARDLSCAEWLAYRTGDKCLAGQGLVLTT